MNQSSTSVPIGKYHPLFREHWSIHLALFILTFFTTTLAGVGWLSRNPFDFSNFSMGIPFSFSIILILTCHEFGHYFAARHHHISATLPYFIPFPPFFPNFGTMGAVIRTKSPIPSKKILFDIGTSGPLAGFAASLIVLVYGFTHLPSSEFIQSIHPDYDFTIHASAQSGGVSLTFGDTILFTILRDVLVNPVAQYIPPMSEIYHYPFLCAGWFGLFITSLNLIPMGQLDGGHLTYALFGSVHKKIALTVFFVLVTLGMPSFLDAIIRTIRELFSFSDTGQIVPFAQYSWTGWVIWAFIIYFLLKPYHPPVQEELPVDFRRKVIGGICIIIFILCFSLNPIIITS